MDVQVNSTTQGNLPGVDTIGIGYDVNGFYANPESLIGQQLFNFGAKTDTITIGTESFTYPSCMHVTMALRSDFINENSQNIEDYRNQVSLNVGVSGSYKLFTGSLNVDFSSDSQENIQTYYSANREIHKLWIITLPGIDWLQQHLLPQAAKDINNASLDPLALFSKYGAYFTYEVGIGGRIDYTAATRILNVTDSTQLSQTSQASYKAMVGKISVTTGSKLAIDIASFQSNSSIRLTSVGGQPGLADKILHGSDPVGAYSDWAASLVKYPSLMFFTNEGLCPIWSLASDKARQKALIDAFPVYMSNAQKPIQKNTRVLSVATQPPMIQACNDRGLGASGNVEFFIPSNSATLNWVGEYAQSNYNSWDGNSTPTLTDIYQLGLLKPPTGWQQIWNDHGSHKSSHYSVWRAIPPQGYRVLGDVAIFGSNNYDPPNSQKYMCVHESLCIPLQADQLTGPIWTDRGSESRQSVTLWSSKNPNAVISNTFFGVPNYNNPPSADDMKAVNTALATLDREYVI